MAMQINAAIADLQSEFIRSHPYRPLLDQEAIREHHLV